MRAENVIVIDAPGARLARSTHVIVVPVSEEPVTDVAAGAGEPSRARPLGRTSITEYNPEPTVPWFSMVIV
ncbi:MAG: hypothetical protein FD127_2975 [Acidimicrobiaceae bacterium]|nr:MAG: hypothetical protein FD127_2975 [Acidimicrobiaceae bacterium]